MFKKIKNWYVDQIRGMLIKHPSENGPYFHLIIAILCLVASVFLFYLYLTFETPIESDFISKQYTLKEFSWDKEENTSSILTEEICGKLYVVRNINFSREAFTENIKVGDTFDCKIKNDESERLLNCKSVKIWEITKNQSIYMSLDRTIESEISDKSVSLPILAYSSLFAFLFFYSLFSITRKYNKEQM